MDWKTFMKRLLCVLGHRLSTVMVNGDIRCERCERWFSVGECSEKDLADSARRAEIEMPGMKYSDPCVPLKYKCEECGATNCKLWREYQTNSPSLCCCDCGVKSQHKEWLDKKDFAFKEDGTHNGYDHGDSDAIGWRVPAVPTEDGIGYWGYTSVPDEGVAWWKRLPLRMKKG